MLAREDDISVDRSLDASEPAPAAKAAVEHGEFEAMDLARESAGVVDRLGSHHFWGCAATQVGRQPQNFR